MSWLQYSQRIHKWVALIVGIQILLWIAGGFVMSVIPIEDVRGQHKVTKLPNPVYTPGELISLVDATNRADVKSLSNAQLGSVLEEPVWRLSSSEGQTVTVNALTGEVISPIGEPLARDIANADYNRDAKLAKMELVSNPPAEYSRPGPVWRAQFDDADKTTLYIDPATAAVRARRSDTWRFYDLFWRLHVMDYDDGEDFNHPLLITSAGAALFVALTGLILLVIRMRRSILMWTSARKRKLNQS